MKPWIIAALAGAASLGYAYWSATPANAQGRCGMTIRMTLKDGSTDHITVHVNSRAECESRGPSEVARFMSYGLYRSVRYSCFCR